MNSTEDVILDTKAAICIGTLVALFLLDTGRGLNAIQLCKECLILLNNEKLKKEEQFLKLFKTNSHRIIFRAYYQISDYTNAVKYGRELLLIYRECGETAKEWNLTVQLAEICRQQCKYVEAQELCKRAISIMRETGNRKGEGIAYGNLGVVYYHLREYVNAKEYHEKALVISMETGDRAQEARSNRNLGTVFRVLNEHVQAIKCNEKALAISMEIGDRKGEASSYGNLGTVFEALCEYVQAKECQKKALAINMEIGDRAGQVANYGDLGTVFRSLGEYEKAKECHEKALAISTEIGYTAGKASSYGNLGIVFQSLGEYVKAKECHEIALAISMENGDREREAAHLGHLATVFQSLREHVKAKEYLEKALAMSMELGNRSGEAANYANLGKVFLSLDEYVQAKKYIEKALAISMEIGDRSELGRASALADLMAAQYCIERQISANPQSWIGIENAIKKESKCTCLYISYYGHWVFLWILTMNGDIHFLIKKVNESNNPAALVHDLDDFFAKRFRSFGILPDENCEDRSLNMVKPYSKSSHEESLANLRLVEDNDEDNQDPEPLFYKMLIAPVTNLLKELEIIIVPDRALYQVPFAALRDEDGNYLSESFRIRIVPSLSTLKLIQDSPADYHSQTGALIVGDPEVGRVLYKGRTENITPLPCARKEADMIGQLLGVLPLVGEHATKQAVLQMIHSVSLIHFAAHGNAERGEIALSPVRTTYRTPQEEEYLLTMSDISQVQLRAKLVVLSCCHSGRGQIRAEGVVGIARAFLGSGARSVLVALWALEDRATEQLMRRFYEHLVRGESASESLHEAMKWMRCNGFPKVCDWAPFVLIGDNVTFDFGKVKEERP